MAHLSDARGKRSSARSPPSADWVLAIFKEGPYAIDARAHEVGLPVSVARRSSNSGAPVWNAAGDRQPCRTAGVCAFSLLARITQRDAGGRVRTLRAATSSRVLAD
jgi:hypothetical protein